MNFLNLGIQKINGKSMKTYRNFEWLKDMDKTTARTLTRCVCSAWNMNPHKLLSNVIVTRNENV